MTKKAKAAIIELTGFIPAAGHAVAFWKSEDNQTEERELLPERYYKPDTTYFKTKYKDTGIRIRDYGRGVAVLQNTNTMETVMIAENIVDMVAQEETKEEFLLKKLEEYDFEEKRRRS